MQLDALRLSRLADYVNIKYDNKIYKVHSIDYEEPEWNDKGCYAWVDAIFTINSVVSKNYQAEPTRGEYSDDYANDFVI